MNQSLRQDPKPDHLSSLDTARYSHDLILQLKSMAEAQNQTVLAKMLELAALEAERLTLSAQG